MEDLAARGRGASLHSAVIVFGLVVSMTALVLWNTTTGVEVGTKHHIVARALSANAGKTP